MHHIYAGVDALSVDEVVLADLGVDDARLAPIVRQAYHWFGLNTSEIPVDGVRPALGEDLRGAHASRMLRGLGAISYPIYMYLSNHGELFVPAFDTSSFPPLRPVGLAVGVFQRIVQRAFGLRAPDKAI